MSAAGISDQRAGRTMAGAIYNRPQTVWQRLFVCAYLTMLFGPIYSLFSGIEGMGIVVRSSNSTIYMAIWAALYALLAANTVFKYDMFFVPFLRGWAVYLFFIFAIFSYLSYTPEYYAVYIKFAGYVFSFIFGSYLSSCFGIRNTMKYLILIGPFILIFHFLAYPIASNMIDYDLLGRSNVLGFKPYGGFFGHKNLAGIAFGVLAVCAFDDQALLAFGKFRKVWVGLYFVALLATGAAGPLIATIMALILAWGLKLIVRRSQFSFFFLLGSSFTAALAALVGANGLLSLVGRTSGMTGRDMLFEAWRIYFWQRPMLGYGYANFFTGLPDSPGAQLMWLTPWHKVFLTFESSYLEAAIQFGIFGCILLFIIYIMGFYKALKGAMTDPTDSVPRTMVALLVLILVSSISDTYLTLQNSIFPTLVAASFYAVYARPAPRRTRRNEPIPGGGAARA